MTLFKGHYSIFRCLGLIGSIFVIIQAGVCILLATIGIFCYFVQPEIKSYHPVGHAFCFLYFSNSSENYSNYIDPIFFHLIMWLSVIIYCVWIFFSHEVLRVFFEWKDKYEINVIAGRWIHTTMAVCIFDLIIFILFLVEIFLIMYDTDFNKQMPGTDNIILTCNHTAIDCKTKLLNNQVFIETLITLKREKLEALRNKQSRSDINPFVHHQIDELRNDSMQFSDEKSIVMSNTPNIMYGVCSWFAAPPAIVMTIVMKTYIGWLANIIIIALMNYLNTNRARPCTECTQMQCTP